MAFILDAALDAGLNRALDLVENMYICSQEPTTFTEASSTYKLGTKATPTIAAAANGTPNGRSRSIQTFTDGTVDASGTATHWALTDNSLSELDVTGALSASQAVTSGNSWSLTGAVAIRFADAA